MDLSALSTIEEYRQRAAVGDIGAMSGRNGRNQVTAAVADAILDAIKAAHGTLVDVGCGDGTLLQKALVHSPDLRCIGIQPTAEEIARLHAVHPHLDIRCGTVHRTGLPDAFVDFVVCNSVLHVAPPFEPALREFRRIAKRGALIFVGDLPHMDERRRRSRVARARVVASNLKHHGFRAAGAVMVYLARAALSGRWTELTGKPHCWIAPSDFVQLTKQCDLELIERRRSRFLNERDEPIESTTRWDYLLRAA